MISISYERITQQLSLGYHKRVSLHELCKRLGVTSKTTACELAIFIQQLNKQDKIKWTEFGGISYYWLCR